MRILVAAVLVVLAAAAGGPLPNPACLVPAPYHCDPKPR
jgi:hypothetical protein